MYKRYISNNYIKSEHFSMKNHINKILKKDGGFTLLELLIVIVIIGILAVLIVPNLTAGPKRARDAQRKSDLRNVKTALESYFNDNNVYPNAANYAALSTSLVPGLIKALPADPKAGNPVYTYTSASPYSSYTLTATCENASDPACPLVGTVHVYTVQSVN